MKLTIKVKKLNCFTDIPEIIAKGDWVDLKAAADVIMEAPQAGILKRHKVGDKEESHRDVSFDIKLIPLGVAMKLPKGFEAIVAPRSSTHKKFGIMQANQFGIIDNCYCGNNDEWKFPAVAMRDTTISKGDRICQFRIQLSQKATFWQKLKWFLSSGIKFVEVESLDSISRGGFGSTGLK